MKIVIAPDKFKGSATAASICDVLSRALIESGALPPDVSVVNVPLADGGEGTVDIIAGALSKRGWRVRRMGTGPVEDPLGRPIDATWVLADVSDADAGGGERGGVNRQIDDMAGSGSHRCRRMAIIEMAAASGMHLLTADEHDPLRASTFGTGQLIAAALEHDPDRIVVGIGGSATVDGGVGCAAALGVRFLDDNGTTIARPDGAALSRIAGIDMTGTDPRLADTEIIIAADVENPLTGSNGAAHVYGPQKGASPDQVKILDAGLGSLAALVVQDMGLVARNTGIGMRNTDDTENKGDMGNVDLAGNTGVIRNMATDRSVIPGAGAAGGLGFGLMTFLNGTVERGIDIVLDLTGFDTHVDDADVVITGEGRFDEQSLSGKVVSAVVRRCEERSIPVVVVAGTAPEHMKRAVRNGEMQGIAALFTLVERDDDAAAVARSMHDSHDAFGRIAAALARSVVNGM